MKKVARIGFVALALVCALGFALWQMGLIKVRAPEANPSFHSDILKPATLAQLKEAAIAANSSLVLINFWASWCEPCKTEFPHLLQIQKDFVSKGLTVFFISMDDSSELPLAEKFLRENGVQFVTYFRSSNEERQMFSKIFPKWSGAIPATVLLSPDFTVRDGWEGETSKQEFLERIGKLLEVKPGG